MLRTANALANLGERNKPIALEDVQVPADRCLRELEVPRQVRNGFLPPRLDYLEDAFSCTLQWNVSRPERPLLGRCGYILVRYVSEYGKANVAVNVYIVL